MATLVHDTLCATLSGLSKMLPRLWLPGRLGFVFRASARRGEYLAALELLSSLRLCSNVPAQWAVQTALGAIRAFAKSSVPAAALRVAARNREAVAHSRFLKLQAPRGRCTPSLALNTQALREFDDQQLRSICWSKRHVLVAPGVSFNVPYRNHFRVTTLPDPTMLRVVFARIEECWPHTIRKMGKPRWRAWWMPRLDSSEL